MLRRGRASSLGLGPCAMTDHDAFDSYAYLHTFYGDVGDQRARYLMDYLHDVFQSLQELQL